MHSLRAIAKFLRVIAWVLRGYWMVRTTFPKFNDEQQARAVEVWARGMLAIIGIEVRVKGHPAQGPVLMAANHISWLDILVMHAACHCRFVAKSEIRSWPLVGVLTTGGGSLYIERGSRNDAMRVVHQMAEALQQGQVLAVFPEGVTGDGITVLPFHANLLQAAISAEAPVQPIALQFFDAQTQEQSLAPCYRHRHPATSPFAANKLADLPKFTGTEPNTGLAFDRWLQTITSHFALFPAFFDDGNRVSAAIQCLGGPAQDWVRVNAPSPFTPNCWANFIATLEATFAPLDRSLAARAELASCHQIGTAQDYLLRFNLASAPITNLHPAEKFERFKEGLKHNIRRSMMVDHPEIIDFASAAAYAVRYDMLSSATTTTPPPAPRPAAPYRPPPARLNAVTSPAPASTTTRPRAPITPEERAHIVAVGGCTYCRNVLPPLHLLEACPTRPARPAYLLGNGRSQ